MHVSHLGNLYLGFGPFIGYRWTTSTKFTDYDTEDYKYETTDSKVTSDYKLFTIKIGVQYFIF
jgi:hypothetical protein